MELVVKILITVTVAWQVIGSWVSAVALTVGAMAASGDVKAKAQKTANRLANRAFLATFWLVPILVLTWVYL